MTGPDKKNVLFIGPLPPPVGGVSIHIKRLCSLIGDDFNIDYVDESHSIKEDYFNLRTYKLFSYFRKVRRSDMLYVHSGKRQLVIFHVLIGKLFWKKVILTVHGYPYANRSLLNFIDSMFYSMADRIIVVNSFILDRVKLPPRKCVVKSAFVPPVMEYEPELPGHLLDWIRKEKNCGRLILSANAYQLKYFNSQDLYGLDMCIEAAGRLISKGFPVSFIYIVSSVDKNRDLFENYQRQIISGKFSDHFLLLNEQISFVKLITYSDIILRPTNTDGDALTIREAILFGRPVLASDVIPRPSETILFKNRDDDDLERKLISMITKYKENEIVKADLNKEYRLFYTGLLESVFNSSAASLNLLGNGKLLTEKIPPSAGVMLNYIPFSLRLGRDYLKYYDLTGRMMTADPQTRLNFTISGFNKIYTHFRKNCSFYNNYIESSESAPDIIRTLEDISNVPLITKSVLRETPVEKRTIMKRGLSQFNTGGTSGSPLSFFLDNAFYSREWSHMHYMWNRIGYKPTSTKITIRGRNLINIYKYRYNQNEFLINSYYSFTTRDYIELLRVFKKYNTEYIHGYPSAIYNFLKEVSVNAPFLLDFLRKQIKGIMFGSEFPSPHFRDYIESILTSNTISWYGHTEGVILAGELYEKYVYVPFLSYGYTEAVKKENQYHLVGTSFDNFSTPFIRYDTEDLISPNFNSMGSLESFEITEGRLGEFVIDKNNRKISLTALIFGRHHKLFDRVNFIQVKQVLPGTIKVYYSNYSLVENPSELFDSTNLNMDVQFEQVKEPFKTSFGKIPLLIK